jgi:putative spermidine/putrescine transport system permease protein
MKMDSPGTTADQPFLARRRIRPRVAWLMLPLAVVMLFGYLAPLGQSLVNSFHPNTPAGIDTVHWTLANYAKLLDPFYFGIFVRTLRISLVISLITAVLAYPIAIYIARLGPRAQALMLLAYMAPWLVNVVVKAFGWSLLLRGNGIINQVLRELGIIDAPLQLMFNETGVVIGLVHGHFMFVLLPLWVAISGLDPNLRWAAGNLGAPPWRIFAHVVFPLTLPALVAGAIINFTMNMAAFATPAILGGSRTRVISYVAYEINLVDLNWPFGGAMAVALLVITLVLVSLAQWLARTSNRAAFREPAA